MFWASEFVTHVSSFYLKILFSMFIVGRGVLSSPGIFPSDFLQPINGSKNSVMN